MAVGVNHQPGVQKAGERNAVLRHAFDGGQDDLAHGAGMNLRRDHRRGRVSPHAAGVGAGIAVQQALVVLAGGQRGDVLAVAHDDEAGFFALQKFFDDNARAAFVVRHAQRVVAGVGRQHEVNRLVRFSQRQGHHHALAGGQAIGLDDDGRAFFVDIGVRGQRVREGVVLGRRNAVALHEGLGESLGTLQLRGGLGRAENPQTVGTEFVHDAGGQRLLGADHGQDDFFGLRPDAQGLHVGDGNIFKPRIQRGAAIAGGHINRLQLGRLRQLPGQRMFAATTAHNQNFHELAFNFFQPTRRPGARQPGIRGRWRRCERRPGCRPGLPECRAIFAFWRRRRRSARSCCRPAW